MRTSESDLSRLYREHAGAITARLVRLCDGDFELAEAALHEAFAAAPAAWQTAGRPAQPRAWLARTAQHKASEKLQRQERFDLVHALAERAAQSSDDDYLRLIFLCCHPALSADARVALTLRMLCGLTTEQIAQAFALEPATVAQRLLRAKNKLRSAKVAYVVPDDAELEARLTPVLVAVYRVFSEGYAAHGGEVLVRSELCGEALRLGRLLTGLLPKHAEPWALLALMLLHESRSPARLSKRAELLLLSDQDRTLWNQAQIEEGLGCLDRALGLGSFGVYALQATIAALHARARSVDETDWTQIASLYQRLLARTQHADVALHHAAAVAMAEGPERGLSLLNGLADDPSISEYHLFYAARADLLRRLGQLDAAARDYSEALRLVGNEPERLYLARRLSELAH